MSNLHAFVIEIKPIEVLGFEMWAVFRNGAEVSRHWSQEQANTAAITLYYKLMGGKS